MVFLITAYHSCLCWNCTWIRMFFNMSYNKIADNCINGCAKIWGKVVRTPACPPTSPLCSIDFHTCPTRKYSSIFKHIQLYLRFIFKYLEICPICPVCLVCIGCNRKNSLLTCPLGPLDSLWMPSMTTLIWGSVARYNLLV